MWLCLCSRILSSVDRTGWMIEGVWGKIVRVAREWVGRRVSVRQAVLALFASAPNLKTPALRRRYWLSVSIGFLWCDFWFNELLMTFQLLDGFVSAELFKALSRNICQTRRFIDVLNKSIPLANTTIIGIISNPTNIINTKAHIGACGAKTNFLWKTFARRFIFSEQTFADASDVYLLSKQVGKYISRCYTNVGKK